MWCSATKDQPIRVRLTKKGVIHAAAYYDYGGFTRYHYNKAVEHREEYVPKQKRLAIACHRWDRNLKGDLESYIVSNKEAITCKLCIKHMGMDDSPVSPQRYVVRRIDTGEFMKNTSSRCSGWSDSLTDAFFFRREHTAKRKCEVYRYQVDNKFLTYKEWAAAGRPEHSRKRLHDPNLEVKKVKITLED